MSITNAFRNAIATGDVRGIRIMMKDSLLVDPTFTEFAEMEILTQNISGVYDSYDDRAFEEDKSAWNDDYMNKIMVQVVGNFSPERIKHLKDVVRHLNPVAVRPQKSAPGYTRQNTVASSKQTSRPHNYYAPKRQHMRNGRVIEKRGAKIVVGAVVGGVLGGTTAAVAGGSFLIGATLGAAVISVVVAVTTNGRSWYE